VPHPTTLMKLTTRCGQDAVAGLNEALLARAAGQKLLRTARVRADTTVTVSSYCVSWHGLQGLGLGMRELW
jgi:IS5 family transposase